MGELPAPDDYQEPITSQPTTSQSTKKPVTYNLEKNFDDDELEGLDYLAYPRPNDLLYFEDEKICYNELKSDADVMKEKVTGLKNKKQKMIKLIAELRREKRARGAPWVIKFGKPSIRENLVVT